MSKEFRMKPHRIILCSLIGALVMGWEVRWVQPPTHGGTLYIALPGDPAFFNANQGPAPGAEAAWIGHNIYNSLLTITPPPELKIVPELAKSWEVLDEGRTYVFNLVEGVKFHDGTDFNAHAAKWNVDRILDPAVNAWVRPYYTEVERVDVVDTSTLRVRMKEPSGALPIALAGYFQGIPMISPIAYEKYGKDWIRHPVGTGPYIFKEWIPGSRVVLKKNPRYFKPGLPYLDTLEFRIINDPLMASTALQSGEIDFMARVPIEHVAALERSPDIRLVTGPDMTPTMGFLNPRTKPFLELRARRAVGGMGSIGKSSPGWRSVGEPNRW
jgi:ABC-type transport system substrate-binding protein